MDKEENQTQFYAMKEYRKYATSEHSTLKIIRMMTNDGDAPKLEVLLLY